MIRDDFGILLLTHGRAENISTLHALEKAGYTGKLYIVIDDEDDQEMLYRQKYGDKVVQFCKKDVAAWTDCGDNNYEERRAILWARNASFEIARKLGLTYFMMFEDDFNLISTRVTDESRTLLGKVDITRFDEVLEMAIQFLDATGAKAVCFGQGGDYIGGLSSRAIKKDFIKRKAMNSFICRADNPIKFAGRFNEDATNYTLGWLRGQEVYSIMPIMVNQKETQSLKGGMTEVYKEAGTYVKTAMSLMYAPSCLRVSLIGVPGSQRVHHEVLWEHTAPKILPEIYKKK